MPRCSRSVLSLALLIAAACADAPRDPLDPSIIAADPSLGRVAFEQSCPGCHASNDGFDLRTFGFTDTTIVRRAVRHVDSATARNIVAYIHELSTPQNEKMLRLFQPGGMVLTSDVEFATRLFGRDAWPQELTTSGLAAIDPRTVAIAVRLPVWADETSNMDWMPDFPLPSGVLNYSGGLAAGAIAGYRAAPTKENLIRAISAIRSADRSAENVSAPCLLEDTVRVRYRECFEARRWASTLIALFMLKNGMDMNLGGSVHDMWWDVGNSARKSRADRSVPIANPEQNWTSWMYLGWSFDPSKHSSSYLGGGFRQLALMRHATFVALRSEIARPKNSMSVYEDMLNAERFSPAGWTTSAFSFALRHVNERLGAGERPADAAQTATAIAQVNTALAEAYVKVPVGDRGKLDALAQPILATLGGH